MRQLITEAARQLLLRCTTGRATSEAKNVLVTAMALSGGEAVTGASAGRTGRQLAYAKPPERMSLGGWMRRPPSWKAGGADRAAAGAEGPPVECVTETARSLKAPRHGKNSYAEVGRSPFLNRLGIEARNCRRLSISIAARA